MEYPQIEFKKVYELLSFMLELKKNPSLLDKAPYDDMTKKALSDVLLKKYSDDDTSKKNLHDVDIEEETVRLYESMQLIDIKEDLDPREQIALIKLKTTTLKDLLDMMKESKEIKNVRQFENAVLEILTEEQANRVIDLIK